MNTILSLIPTISLTPLNIAVTLLVLLVATIFLSCAIAGVLRKSDKTDIVKWG